MNTFLRPYGFRRAGQRYGRESEQCWHIIGIQKSRYSDLGEVRFTVNFGITSKALMEFHGQDVSKMPLDWVCPIRYRIGELMEQGDVWWSLKDGTELQSAITAISTSLSEKAIAFLNGLNRNEGILQLCDLGIMTGFEIDRDEIRAVLLAHTGLRDQAAERLNNYKMKWLSRPAAQRAKNFLEMYRAKFDLQ